MCIIIFARWLFGLFLLKKDAFFKFDIPMFYYDLRRRPGGMNQIVRPILFAGLLTGFSLTFDILVLFSYDHASTLMNGAAVSLPSFIDKTTNPT